MDDQFRISRLMRIYFASGGLETDLVKPFETWPESVATLLSESLSVDESPFLAFFESPSKWTMLTLNRIVWKNGGDIQHANFSDLLHASAQEAFNEVRAQILQGKDSAAHAAKKNANRLQLDATDGTKSIVEFEPGGAFYGFWNVVKLRIRQARMANDEYPKIHVQGGFDENFAHDVRSRGWLGDVEVELADGSRHPVFFYDPVRLAQELEMEIKLGHDYIAEKGMIVLKEITQENMRKAVKELSMLGFFGN